MGIDAVIAEFGVIDHTPDAVRPMTDLAAVVARVPMATVNILTEDRQYQVATVGFDATVCDRKDSMCRYAVELARPVIVADASVDPRFRHNPFVNGELGHVRFYASFPLQLRMGPVIGSLCVFDTVPREIDSEQTSHLQTLAGRIIDILELTRSAHGLESALLDVARLTEELQRSNDHLAAFSSEVSHDLGSPLSTVQLAFAMLRREVETTPDRSRAAARWITTGEHAADLMRGMIEDFLQFAKLGGAAAREPVPLDDVVAAAATRLGILQDDPMLRVGELPVVLGNAGQLTAVVHNLLSNALKFSPTMAEIEVGARRDGTCWCVEVADRGRGIDPDQAEALFDPLVRGHHHAEVDGTGIGLSICRRIVQAHGGSIGLRPREGGGTIAWFTVPSAD